MRASTARATRAAALSSALVCRRQQRTREQQATKCRLQTGCRFCRRLGVRAQVLGNQRRTRQRAVLRGERRVSAECLPQRLLAGRRRGSSLGAAAAGAHLEQRCALHGVVKARAERAHLLGRSLCTLNIDRNEAHSVLQSLRRLGQRERVSAGGERARTGLLRLSGSGREA